MVIDSSWLPCSLPSASATDTEVLTVDKDELENATAYRFLVQVRTLDGRMATDSVVVLTTYEPIPQVCRTGIRRLLSFLFILVASEV